MTRNLKSGSLVEVIKSSLAQLEQVLTQFPWSHKVQVLGDIRNSLYLGDSHGPHFPVDTMLERVLIPKIYKDILHGNNLKLAKYLESKGFPFNRA